MIGVEVSGEDFRELAKEALEELKPGGLEAVQYGAELIADYARRLLSRPAPGRQASAPGEPPGMETGKLRDSIKVSPKARWRGFTCSAKVGSRRKGAGAHEFGGRVGVGKAVRLPPRPYMRPAEAKAEPLIDARFEEFD